MRPSAEQPERLVEILREILALSKTTGDSGSVRNRPNEFFDAERVNGIGQTGASPEEKPGEKRSES
jgi:hypothetical protein